MASQMRCDAMLQKVAKESRKAECWLAAEIRGGAQGISKFQVGHCRLAGRVILRTGGAAGRRGGRRCWGPGLVRRKTSAFFFLFFFSEA
jgi:hypothetical protein